VAVFAHAVDHPVAAVERRLMIAHDVVVVRRLGQCAEIGRLADGQLVQRFVEVVEGRGRDAVIAGTEIDLVEIELEDAVLGERLFDAQREDHLADLALVGDFVGQQEVLGDLLRDGGRADRSAVAVILDVDPHCVEHARQVDAGMGVEGLVLGREERVDDALRHRGDRHEHAVLCGVFGEQAAIAGIDARDHRRIIAGELVVIRQVLREVLVDQPGRDTAHDTQEQQRAEQERENSGQSHDRAGPGPLLLFNTPRQTQSGAPLAPLCDVSALVQAMMLDQG
jgi:hypothetical protein